MKRFFGMAVVAFLSALLTGCPMKSGQNDFVYGEAQIESVDILILESFPVQVHVAVAGYVGDGCTEIYQITKKREENTFMIKITTRRPKEGMCIQILKGFEERISLDVYGLAKGNYIVNVNGTIKSFELAMDNSPLN